MTTSTPSQDGNAKGSTRPQQSLFRIDGGRKKKFKLAIVTRKKGGWKLLGKWYMREEGFTEGGLGESQHNHSRGKKKRDQKPQLWARSDEITRERKDQGQGGSAKESQKEK